MQTLNPFKNQTQPIIVKFMARMPPDVAKHRFLRHFPGNVPVWGKCHFAFDPKLKVYDWLVVYHDLYRKHWSLSVEQLRCPREKTILITTEPSTIAVYGSDYLRQFGFVLTSQEPWAIPHPRPIFSQPSLVWYYGWPLSEGKIHSYDEIKAAALPEKKKIISTVCSSKRGNLTLHNARCDFTEQIQNRVPELDRFGHGINPVSDKAEALDPYQYHIAIENHICLHHLTEKLTDAFLGFTLPFYYGCPNAADYFPANSFIPIDIGNFERTVAIIQSTIANNEYKDRLPYIIEARRRVLEEHNLFAVLERIICSNNSTITTGRVGGTIMNRQTIRVKKPLVGIRSIVEKIVTKEKHRILRKS